MVNPFWVMEEYHGIPFCVMEEYHGIPCDGGLPRYSL